MTKRIFALASLVALAACGGDAGDATVEGDTTTVIAPATDTMMAPPAATTPMPGDTMGMGTTTPPATGDTAAMGTTTPATGDTTGAAGTTTTPPTP